MRNKLFMSLTPLALLASALTLPADADAANIGACGDINVEANAQCEVKVGVECKADCTPLNFTASCAAECSGTCNASFEASCTGGCQADCNGQCEANPGSFDCSASCNTQCKADCSGHCSASNNRAQCEGSCEASCEGECSASCEGTPPSATCDAKCEASCEGHCTAEANVDCQIDCSAGCTAELTGGCEVECDTSEGALFCDGQYIDHGGNLEECIDALRSVLNITVDASGSAACDGGSCKAEGKVGVGCATSPETHQPPGVWLALAAGALLGLGRRRRGR